MVVYKIQKGNPKKLKIRELQFTHNSLNYKIWIGRDLKTSISTIKLQGLFTGRGFKY